MIEIKKIEESGNKKTLFFFLEKCYRNILSDGNSGPAKLNRSTIERIIYLDDIFHKRERQK